MLAATSHAPTSQRLEQMERSELRMTSLLAQFAATRDSLALQQIIEGHAGLVYSTCLRIVGDPHLADDAGQAVFLIFTRKAATLRPDTPLPAWFYRTAVNVAQRANRDRRTRQRYEQEAAAMRAQQDDAAAGSASLWAELRPKLDALLKTLPAAERDALVLRYLAGKTEPEAAQALGCPVGTLSARVSRALAKLRQRIGGSAAVLPATLLGLAIEQNATHAAPAHFATSLHAACLGTAGASASVAAQTLAEGTMKALFWLKVKIIAAVLLISALVGVPITMKLSAGESGPVVKGDKAPPIPAPHAPVTPVIPKTISFGPRAQKEPLIYERLTQTDCTDRPAVTAIIKGLLPEYAVDCQLFELTTVDEKDRETIKIQCLKTFCVTPYSHEVKDGNRKVVNLVGISDEDKSKLPSCIVSYKPDGTSSVIDFREQTPTLNVANPGIQGTIGVPNGGLGILMLHQVGFLPVCSTAGKPRAVHDTWIQKNVILEKFELPISYSLEKVEAVNGRLLATIKSIPKVTELDAQIVPSETIEIGAVRMTLAPKSLSGECTEELLVDVEQGVVLHHFRIVKCKLGYKLDLPESMPEVIRKMAGSDLVLGVRFTMEDTLLDKAQAELLIDKKITPEAAEKVLGRWKKRKTGHVPPNQMQTSSAEMVGDLADIIGLIATDKYNSLPQRTQPAEAPKKDEF